MSTRDELERAKQKMQATRKAFYALFERPTREAAELNLRLHTLERDGHIIDRDVPDEAERARRRASIDEEIAKLRHIIALREKANEAIKCKFELADKTLPGSNRKKYAARATDLLGELARENRGDVDLTDLGISPELLKAFLGELD